MTLSPSPPLLRVAALTSGRNVPSARFRIRQHIAPLRAAGIAVREHAPPIEKYAPLPGFAPLLNGTRPRPAAFLLPCRALWEGAKLAARIPGVVASWHSDVTWLGRELLPGCRTLEPALKRPYVLDVDDAIWLSRPWAAAAIGRVARDAALVLAGNAYLAEWLGAHCRDVRVVPTAIDCERFRPRDTPPASGENDFVIGWTGSSSNLKYLHALEMPLRRFLGRHANAVLCVVADRAPQFSDLPAGRVRFVRWSPDVEANAVRAFDAGLMPLPDEPAARGKCSFKMLQYMACGVPVVVSPVGMNAEVLARGDCGFAARTPADWEDALEALHADPDTRARLGAAGRVIAERHYSRAVVGATLAQVFGEFA